MSMLSMAKRLRDAGFTDVQVEALGELVEQTFATKDDLAQVHKDLSGRIEQVRKDLTTEIGQVRKDMAAEFVLMRKDMAVEIALVRRDMDALGNKLTIRLGAMLCVAIGVVATLVKLL